MESNQSATLLNQCRLLRLKTFGIVNTWRAWGSAS